MTLKSVVLPAPFGPMMPTRSPSPTSKLTSRTAVRPPKRLVTRSSVSMLTHSTASSPRADPRRDAHQALGCPAHHQDEDRSVDDEVDPREAGPEARELRAQVRLEGRDQQRAHERAERRAEAPDDAVQREADREVDREHVEGVDEPDVLRPETPAHGGQRSAHDDRAHLQPPARDA